MTSARQMAQRGVETLSHSSRIHFTTYFLCQFDLVCLEHEE